MIYLFSSIGGHDPVSSDTEHDGSMLHICRYYKPDKVILFLSELMYERQQEDDRYRYCIRELGKRLEHDFIIDCIEDLEHEDVQDYNYYYKRFEEIIKNIKKDMKPEDVLYLNVSSGTPAMKNALLFHAALEEKNIIPIQVTTPINDINSSNGVDRDYDPEYYWAVNKDNEKEQNRCVQPMLKNLSVLLKKQSLIQFVDKYNYAAAFSLAQELKEELPKMAYDLVELALARLQLNLVRAKKLVYQLPEEDRIKILPMYSENNKDRENIFEYAVNLKIKILNKEYGDFLRAISPLLTDIFEVLLSERSNIDISKYVFTDSNKVRKWDVMKLKADMKGREFLNLLDNQFHGNFKNGPVSASNLKVLLMEFLEDDKLKNEVCEMREIEEKIRNCAAHEIMSFTDENLGEYFGKKITIQSIYAQLQHLTQVALKTKTEDWEAYERMNKMIKEIVFSEI